MRGSAFYKSSLMDFIANGTDEDTDPDTDPDTDADADPDPDADFGAEESPPPPPALPEIDANMDLISLIQGYLAAASDAGVTAPKPPPPPHPHHHPHHPGSATAEKEKEKEKGVRVPAVEISEYIHLRGKESRAWRVLARLPTHYLDESLRQTIRVKMTDMLKARGSAHAHTVPRYEKCAFTMRYTVGEYIQHVGKCTGLLCHGSAYLDEELRLGAATPETLYRVDLSTVCAQGSTESPVYFDGRYGVLQSGCEVADMVMEVLGLDFDVQGDPPVLGGDWKCAVATGPEGHANVKVVRCVPVDWDVCIACGAPQVAFRSVHKTAAGPSQHDTIGFCSVKCFTAINWPSKALTGNINRVRYG